jgi:beta-glucanase (GH16 family)
MLSTRLVLSAITLFGAFILPAGAQVTTDCNPMNKTCPADPAFGLDHHFNFNSTPSSKLWETTAGSVTYSADKGAAFTINKQGDSPTIRSKFYFFFGRTEILMKCATGTGVISSMMWLSDVLDEVDWEFFGTNATFAQTNYFGKGEPDFRNGGYYPVTGKSVHDDYHNYTTVWTSSSLQWYIDGRLVRTLLPKDAENGYKYPQTPMRLSLGIWAGGDPRMPNGTREWAGGDTDYSKGPFTMYVKSAQVTDYSTGKEYVYGDKTGSFQSIKVVE